MTHDIPALLAWYRQEAHAVGKLPAFTFYAGKDRLVQRDWSAQLGAVDHLAAALAQRGVKRGDAVAVLMANSAETPVAYLAVMALGAVLVPLNTTSSMDEWAFIARDCKAVGAIVAEPLRATAAMLEMSLGFVCTPADLYAAPVQALEPQPALADATAVMLYTSGTTGRPKGVMLSHANVLANARAMAAHFGLDGHTQLAVMPLYHAHAFGFGLMSALVSCGHLVLADRLNPFYWAGIVRDEGVRVTSLVPPLLPFLAKMKVRAESVPTLRCLLVSSAPLPTEAAREFIQRTGIPLVHGWGLSEFTNFATCTDAGADVRTSLALLCGQPLPSIGRPLPGVQVEVRNSRGLVQRAGMKGELHVRGPSRMLGYFGADGRCTADEWLATGDEGYFAQDAQGPRFFISGRIKDLIIRDAEKVSPLTVEQRLLEACPELADRLAVLGFAHCLHGEEIGAYVRTADEGPSADLAQRLVRTAHTLGNALRPKVILWGTEPVPTTHTGKVQRARLRSLFIPYEHYAGPTQLERADGNRTQAKAA